MRGSEKPGAGLRGPALLAALVILFVVIRYLLG